jgi:hypothetical protein
MLRADGDPELRVFDPVIRSLHWLTLLLVITTFALAFSIRFNTNSGTVSRADKDFNLIQPHPFTASTWTGRDLNIGKCSRRRRKAQPETTVR